MALSCLLGVARSALLLALLGASGCAMSAPADGVSSDRATPSSIVLRPPAAPGGQTRQVAPSGATRPVYGGALGGVPDEWTWIDFPDSRCANGTPTGIAVDIHPKATHLLLFLEGGGACDNGQDCWVQPTAVNIAGGYGVEQLGADPLLDLSFFQRNDPTNPFADASYVFVPYCTGDLHAGDAIATYDVNGTPTATYHYGAHNLDLYLAKLGGSFPSVDHVWLAGQSAGGFGTLFNESFVTRAFGVRTDVIDDSGPGIGMSGYPTSWNVRLPAGCGYCSMGLGPLFLYDRLTYPETRFAFLSFEIDPVLPGFYGASQADVVSWLGQYEQSFGQLLNTQSFVAPGAGHVVMRDGMSPDTKTALASWLQAMATDDPGWQTSIPGVSLPTPGPVRAPPGL